MRKKIETSIIIVATIASLLLAFVGIPAFFDQTNFNEFAYKNLIESDNLIDDEINKTQYSLKETAKKNPKYVEWLQKSTKVLAKKQAVNNSIDSLLQQIAMGKTLICQSVL